jgi:CheY-like chemotaxis protein
MLQQLGYDVVTAAGGEEAVEYLKRNRVDLVLLDMIMAPGMDGLETYRAISGFRPDQKAIIVSGFSETERVREARSLGAGGYVKKPYVLERIGKAVREELERPPREAAT